MDKKRKEKYFYSQHIFGKHCLTRIGKSLFILKWDCNNYPNTLEEISKYNKFLTAENYKAVKNLLLNVIKKEIIYLDNYEMIIYTHKHSDENDLYVQNYLKEEKQIVITTTTSC